MLVTGTIINKRNNQPVPFASVQLVNEYGQYMNIGTTATADGRFTLSSNSIVDPNALVFSSSGYIPTGIDARLFDGQGVLISLEEKPALEPVVITFTPKKNSLLWLLLVVAAIVTGAKK